MRHALSHAVEDGTPAASGAPGWPCCCRLPGEEIRHVDAEPFVKKLEVVAVDGSRRVCGTERDGPLRRDAPHHLAVEMSLTDQHTIARVHDPVDVVATPVDGLHTSASPVAPYVPLGARGDGRDRGVCDEERYASMLRGATSTDRMDTGASPGGTATSAAICLARASSSNTTSPWPVVPSEVCHHVPALEPRTL